MQVANRTVPGMANDNAVGMVYGINSRIVTRTPWVSHMLDTGGIETTKTVLLRTTYKTVLFRTTKILQKENIWVHNGILEINQYALLVVLSMSQDRGGGTVI